MPLKPRPNVLKVQLYEPGKPVSEVTRELGLTDVVKLASNENPWGPSPKALSALKGSLADINRYPDGGGFYLKEALSAKLGVDPDWIILGNGSDEIGGLLTLTYLDPGDEAVVGDPAFIRYAQNVTLVGGEGISVKLREFTHDLPAMAAAVTPKTKLVFIANPNNPTGTMVTQQEVDNFLHRIPSSVLVVLDEAYYEYIDREDFPKSLEILKERENILILRTFSKIHGLAGLRIGYGIGRPEVISAINRVRPPFNVNSVAQEAALAALDDEEYIEQCRRLNQEGYAYLTQELKRLGIRFVSSVANFILVDVGQDARKVYERLMAEGVIVRPMGGYGLTTHLRVTIGRPEENERFIQAVKKLYSTRA
ncbi:MAG: histidinol-phosphate transaminase [bacterium]|nr:histidinol-phosphate transaminase [bacterium]